MNKIFNYILVLAAAGALFASCKKEVQDVYTPGKPDQADCYGVYFPVQEASGAHTYDPSMDRELKVTVSRSKEHPYIDDAITVPYIVTSSEEGIFECGDIVFESTQSETTITIKFPTAGEGVNYSLNLQISDPKYASVYTASKTSFDFSVMVVSWQYILNPVTNQPALFEFTQDWWGETAWAYIKYYEVGGVRTCFTETQSKHYYNGFYEGYGFLGTAETPEEATEWTFRMYMENKNGEGNYLIELPAQYCGYTDSSGYDRYVSDVLWYYIYKGDLTEDKWLSNAIKSGDPDGSYPCGYYDGNGGIYLYTFGYYRETLAGSWTGSYEVVGIGEGFIRTDYSIEVESDYSSEGSTPVSIETGKDVSYIKYAVYPGELTAPQAANKAPLIIDGTDESVKFDEFTLDEEENIKYATLLLAPETSGLYTFVAVTFNEKDEAQDNAYVVFNHVAAADVEEKSVVVSVFTEDTPARYTNYHKYDSFAFGVAGKNLTEVHIATVPESTIASDGAEAVLASVKADEKGTYAASEDVVKQINAEGGYYTVLSGMSAKTHFYVIVWATNGDMDSFAIADYTTDPMPYVWNPIGKGTWTDGLLLRAFGMDPVTVACDVYEEAITPGLYMVTGFQLELCAAFYEVETSEIADLEGQNWWNAEIVVDATDPAAVYIAEQEYGIYVNGSYGYAMMDSEPEGTLENGVITFPARKMYVGLTKYGWLYGNSQGEFKLTLPSAEAPAISSSFNGPHKTNFVLDAQVWDKPVTKFEREAQPVKVAAKVSAERKQKESSKNFDVTAR